MCVCANRSPCKLVPVGGGNANHRGARRNDECPSQSTRDVKRRGLMIGRHWVDGELSPVGPQWTECDGGQVTSNWH